MSPWRTTARDHRSQRPWGRPRFRAPPSPPPGELVRVTSWVPQEPGPGTIGTGKSGRPQTDHLGLGAFRSGSPSGNGSRCAAKGHDEPWLLAAPADQRGHDRQSVRRSRVGNQWSAIGSGHPGRPDRARRPRRCAQGSSPGQGSRQAGQRRGATPWLTIPGAGRRPALETENRPSLANGGFLAREPRPSSQNSPARCLTYQAGARYPFSCGGDAMDLPRLSRSSQWQHRPSRPQAKP